MDKERILAVLRQHEAEIKVAGILHLRLFGSVARGEATPDSDVDLFIDYDESDSWNLLHALGYQDRVSEILGLRVHLTSEKHLREHLRDHALRETLSVF